MSDNEEQTWHLGLAFYPWDEPKTRDEIATFFEDLGHDKFSAADAFVIMSIVLPPDGSYSQMVYSADGKTKKSVTPADQFKAWIMMSHYLMKHPDLDEGRRAFAAEVFEMMQQMFWRRDEEMPEEKPS